MNLLITFTQANSFPFPFGFGNSGAEEFLKSNGENIRRPENSRSEDKPILSKATITVIGENGKNRFNEFKEYQNGWYGGKGKKISKSSVFTFEQFIKSLPELKRANPSIFLSLEGNLSLGWEDKNGLSIEVEFYPDKMEYFIESLDEESEVKLSNLFELTEKIRKLLK